MASPFVALPGKAEGRTEARRTGRPPPPLPPAPAVQARPKGGPQPKAGQGRNGTGPPPPKKQAKRTTGPRQDTWRGTDRLERPYRRPAPGPRDVRAPRRPTGGGGGEADAARARAHAHARDTRGIPEGQPDQARGTHRPHGMAYQLARIRDTRTGWPATHSAGTAGPGGGGTGKTQSAAPAPTPQNRPRAPRTHNQGTAPRHAPIPRLGSLCASPRGSHWRQTTSTGPAAPAARATRH